MGSSERTRDLSEVCGEMSGREISVVSLKKEQSVLQESSWSLRGEVLLASGDVTEGFGLVYFAPDEIIRRIGFGLPQVWILLVCSFASFSFSGQLMVPVLITNDLWVEWPSLDNDQAYNWLYFMDATLSIIGAVFFACLADTFGRRKLLIWALLVVLIFGLISTFVQSFVGFVAMRALTSAGVGGLGSLFYVFMMEVLPIRRRAAANLFLTGCGTTGVIYVECLAWGLEGLEGNWRWILGLSYLPVVISVAALLFCARVESPRYFCAVGSERHAWQSLIWLAGKPSEEEVHSEEKLARLLGLSFLSQGRIDPECLGVPRNQSAVGYATFLTHLKLTFTNMRLFLSRNSKCVHFYLLCVIWFTQTLAYWGTTSYIPSFFEAMHLNEHWATMGSFLVQYPSLALLYFMLDVPPAKVVSLSSSRAGAPPTASVTTLESASTERFAATTRSPHWHDSLKRGRKGSLMIYSALVSLFLLALVVVVGVATNPDGSLESSKSVTIPGYILSFGAYFCGGPLWAILFLYTPESFPTAQRGAAMSVLGFVNNAPQLITFFIGQALSKSKLPWLYPMIWGWVFCVQFFCTLFLKVETADRPLQDVSAELEGSWSEKSLSSGPTTPSDAHECNSI